MDIDSQAYVTWFRNSSPYINAHRDKTFVVAFAGEAVAHPNFNHVMQDLVLLHSLGIRMILVHGARPQIDQRLQEANLPIQIKHHRRITEQQALPAVIEAISHTRVQVEAMLSQQCAAAHLKGVKALVHTGNYLTAKPYGVHHGIDYQHSGEVRRINHVAIRQQLDQGGLVLLSPLGYSPTGEVFNLLWEEVAEAAAVALSADKLIYLNEEEGILDAQSNLIHELTVAEAAALLPSLTEPNYTLICAHRAVRQGVPRAHAISFQQDGALLQELFTVNGSGTMLTQENYEQIRPAHIDDVASILELLEPLEQQGILVRRSRELLETEISHFMLIERDDKIIACAALYPYPETHCGELACVAVHGDFRHGQRGDTLLRAMELKAKQLGLQQLFVLTTRTAHWFLERGFKAAELTSLPPKRQLLYNFQRNSKVFIKSLPPRID